MTTGHRTEHRLVRTDAPRCGAGAVETLQFTVVNKTLVMQIESEAFKFKAAISLNKIWSQLKMDATQILRIQTTEKKFLQN